MQFWFLCEFLILSGAVNSNKNHKSLEEREAAYAEARMRIFGASQSSDEASGVGDYSNSAVAKQLETMRMIDNSPSIIRQPHGPDGTKGFGANRPVTEWWFHYVNCHVL